MGLYEKIKFLANKQKMSIRKLEEVLGYGNGTIRRWDNQTPGVDKLQAVADYFKVSTDYLLDRTNTPSEIIKKKDLTIEEALASVMSYDGEPLTENDREIIQSIVEAYLKSKG